MFCFFVFFSVFSSDYIICVRFSYSRNHLPDCPGPQSETAGKSDSCEGCPNQEVCATAPKGPDPGILFLTTVATILLCLVLN